MDSEIWEYVDHGTGTLGLWEERLSFWIRRQARRLSCQKPSPCHMESAVLTSKPTHRKIAERERDLKIVFESLQLRLKLELLDFPDIQKGRNLPFC